MVTGKFYGLGFRHNAAGDHIPLGGVVAFRDMCEARATMLKLRSIGIRDYSVRDGQQRVGRIRYAPSAIPASGFGTSASTCPAGCRWDHAKDLDTAKAEFKAAWEALKARTSPEQLEAAYRAMNIRGDD